MGIPVVYQAGTANLNVDRGGNATYLIIEKRNPKEIDILPFVSCFKIFKNRLFKITCADAGGLSGVTNGGPAAGVNVGDGAGAAMRSGVAGSLSISFFGQWWKKENKNKAIERRVHGCEGGFCCGGNGSAGGDGTAMQDDSQKLARMVYGNKSF